MYDAVELNFALPLMTLFTDSRKSFSVANFRRALFSQRYHKKEDYLIANIPASVHTDRSSAPVEFGHSREMSSKRYPVPRSYCFTRIRV